MTSSFAGQKHSQIHFYFQVWKGVDTVIVCAGVSALLPLLEVAGVTGNGDQATADGVQHAVDVSNAALRGNYTGPLVSAVTFVCPLAYSAFVTLLIDC